MSKIEMNEWRVALKTYGDWGSDPENGKLENWSEWENGLEEKYDKEKLCHAAKNKLKQEALEVYKSIEEGGSTVYMYWKKSPGLNVQFYLNDQVKPEEVFEIYNRGLHADSSMYEFFGDAGELTFSTMANQLKHDIAYMKLEEYISDKDAGTSALTLPELTDETFTTMVNTILSSKSLPSYEEIRKAVNSGAIISNALRNKLAEAEQATKKAIKEAERLAKEVTSLTLKAEIASTPIEVVASGEIPNGKQVPKKASELFPGVKLKNDFEVPAWEWDSSHPLVPAVDEDYVFRPEYLERVIYAILTNQRAYLQGHTGSGKTTLIEQVCARLSYPFVRVNFDSEISRMDLIGRDTLTTDASGATVSKFVDGILPNAMQSPCIFCADEIDFVRPDVAYVMQAALEGNSLRLTEDGDRIVRPHPAFRMFATGNTVGQGDEEGMYQGARPQSMAFLDRFTIWVKVDYLSEKQREELVTKRFPALKEDDKRQLLKYTTEHLEAFKGGKVLQPITPRGMMSIARATLIMGLRAALEMTVLDRATKDDFAVLKGVVDRVSK